MGKDSFSYDENESQFAKIIYIMVDSGNLDFNMLSNDFRRIPPPILVNGYNENELRKLPNDERMRALALRNEIWVEAAFLVKEELDSKVSKFNFDIFNDIRFLLKDIDDIERIKSSGKTDITLKPEDLPSAKNDNEYKEREKKREEIVNDPNIRKAFLRNLSKKYNK